MECIISTHVQMLYWQKYLLLLLLTSHSDQRTFYVTPTPDTPCPGEPCHTLSQYVSEQYSERNVRMEFLPGNHILKQTISLANLTQLTLHGDSSSFPEVTSRIVVSVCALQARRGFVFTGSTKLHISRLVFISPGGCGGGIAILESEQPSDISYSIFLNVPLYVRKSILTSITWNTFQNTKSQAIYAQDSTLNLTGNIFQNNSAATGGALFAQDSTLRLTGNKFQENTADYWGGALRVKHSTLYLTGNIFQNNSAAAGGALHIESSTLNLVGNAFQDNSADHRGGVLHIGDSTLNLMGDIFLNNSGHHGGALYVENSSLNLTGNAFRGNSAGGLGGALHVEDSFLNIAGNTFQDNYVVYSGGGLYVGHSTLNLTGNTLQDNSANFGGALHTEHSTLNFTGNVFQNNSAGARSIRFIFGFGGALSTRNSTHNFIGNTFQDNSATGKGGVLYARNCTFDLTESTFLSNSAGVGGALDVVYGNLSLTGNTFQDNSAHHWGGAISAVHDNLKFTGNIFQDNSADQQGGALYAESGNLNFTGNTFYSNSADQGGALYAEFGSLNSTGNTFHSNSAIGSGGTLWLKASDTTFTDNIFTDSNASSGGSIAAIQSSNIRLCGNNIIANNTAQYGGGITIVDSQLKLVGNSFAIQNNTASYGGGMYVHNTTISGSATLSANSATEGGGGIYASRSTFYFTGNITLMGNSAIDGGGLLLSDDSKFYLQQNAHVYFASNSATRNGGAINVEDSNPITYCTETYNSDCFFQIQKKRRTISVIPHVDLNAAIHFDNNSAVEAGADVHGGSVDNCELAYIDTHCNGCPTSGKVFDDMTSNQTTLGISSDPLHICTCRDNQTDCSGSYHPEPVYPGGTLEVPVIARGQRNGSTTANIEVIDTLDIIFQKTDTVQKANKYCTTLKYTIQSTAEHSMQEITLYVEGPCPPKTTSPTKIKNTLRVLIDILDCPPGFQLSWTQPRICICTERLQKFTNTCLVNDKTVLREHDAQFWVGYDTHSRGVILHPHCPFDYCTSKETYMTVTDSNKPCNYNRSGLLCGRCNGNLSLALGSSGCLQCSNSYIALLIAFTFAGIVLVVVLLVLRLTVAAGTISGLIFYANVVAMNSATFFKPQTSSVLVMLIAKVLTVFIAWLNLDLGIETCFYHGMDAYVKTWLQFTFPLYVWVLVGMIILGSYYSSRVAKVFGSNPISVLATLFLLSYAKLLRTVIAALSYTFLEYPNNTHIAVWLYDGNIRYLSGKHIPLFTAAVVCLIFLFLPYTMLLIFSQWLQANSQSRIFSWINGRNLKPFMDAYHAPYTDQHRYWTGLLLLLRFVLFLISAVNALGDPSVNLLATATIAVLTLSTILCARVYKTWCLSLLETSFILNLAILSVASLYIRATGGNQNAATFTSVSIAFATFIGIAIYHSVWQIKSTRLWKRLSMRSDHAGVPRTDVNSGPEDPPDAVFVLRSAPTQTVVAIREYELREPLMATSSF